MKIKKHLEMHLFFFLIVRPQARTYSVVVLNSRHTVDAL